MKYRKFRDVYISHIYRMWIWEPDSELLVRLNFDFSLPLKSAGAKPWKRLKRQWHFFSGLSGKFVQWPLTFFFSLSHMVIVTKSIGSQDFYWQFEFQSDIDDFRKTCLPLKRTFWLEIHNENQGIEDKRDRIKKLRQKFELCFVHILNLKCWTFFAFQPHDAKSWDLISPFKKKLFWGCFQVCINDLD